MFAVLSVPMFVYIYLSARACHNRSLHLQTPSHLASGQLRSIAQVIILHKGLNMSVARSCL